ncbi:hypothetical protein [Candidatus Competibacter phosphatis]|uniref:hypothetical protein n=1 Tax=Candidatus Competibacter phosphatis TaxID=221280 RepID=UPI00145EC2C8|nr:hypothetical protein [Candidatus Competibacter phosphatis]
MAWAWVWSSRVGTAPKAISALTIKEAEKKQGKMAGHGEISDLGNPSPQWQNDGGTSKERKYLLPIPEPERLITRIQQPRQHAIRHEGKQFQQHAGPTKRQQQKETQPCRGKPQVGHIGPKRIEQGRTGKSCRPQSKVNAASKQNAPASIQWWKWCPARARWFFCHILQPIAILAKK